MSTEVRKLSVGSNNNLDPKTICFFPRKRNVEKELPHLRRKYRGGFWGYGHQLEIQTPTRCISNRKMTQTKILLSRHQNKKRDEQLEMANT